MKDRIKKELELAGLLDSDSDYNGMIGESVLELIEVFSNQGHSGMSAPYVADIFTKLAKGDILSPLTGKNDEWIDVSEKNGLPMFQNKRCSSVFKNGNGNAYYLDGIVFTGQNGCSSTKGGVKLKNGKKIGSRQYIKSFPFTPKIFYIDVIETEWADKKESVKK